VARRNMVWISPGTFVMGSSDQRGGAIFGGNAAHGDADEGVLHGQVPVTQGENWRYGEQPELLTTRDALATRSPRT